MRLRGCAPGHNPSTVIASGAKQSIGKRAALRIASSQVLLAMTGLAAGLISDSFGSDSTVKQRTDALPHCRGAMRPGFAWDRRPRKTPRGRRESRVRAAPAVSCAKEKQKTHTSIQVQRRQSGFPCAMGYGLLRALPGDRAFLPPSSAKSFASRELNASVGASGPHGFTVRTACARLSQAARPPHPTARS